MTVFNGVHLFANRLLPVPLLSFPLFLLGTGSMWARLPQDSFPLPLCLSGYMMRDPHYSNAARGMSICRTCPSMFCENRSSQVWVHWQTMQSGGVKPCRAEILKKKNTGWRRRRWELLFLFEQILKETCKKAKQTNKAKTPIAALSLKAHTFQSGCCFYPALIWSSWTAKPMSLD